MRGRGHETSRRAIGNPDLHSCRSPVGPRIVRNHLQRGCRLFELFLFSSRIVGYLRTPPGLAAELYRGERNFRLMALLIVAAITALPPDCSYALSGQKEVEQCLESLWKNP